MTNNLPRDPMLCLSFVNTRLRDVYPNLDELCKAMNINTTDLIEKLKTIDYEYNANTNQFV